MKITKICPKCQSDDIVRVFGRLQGGEYGNNIKTGLTTLSTVFVTRYLCCNCGYIEDWIDDPEDIAKVKKRYINRSEYN